MIQGKHNSIEQLQNENETLKVKIDELEKSKRKNQERKISLTKWVGSIFIGKDLKHSLNNLYEELPNNVTKITIADVTANLIWRFTRIGIFAVIISIIPIWLLFQQNRKIESQNGLIKEQSYLAEASRRSSLVFIMSNIMDNMDAELKTNNASEEPYHPSRKISNVTIGRLAALSQSMKPINYMNSDTILGEALSPERGLLLLSLANSFLSKETYSKIFEKCNFNYSDLNNANLNNLYLKGASLNGSSFENASLIRTNLNEVNLSRGKLIGADLTEADCRNADLSSTNLNNTTLVGVDFRGTDLRLSNLRNSLIAFDVFSLRITKQEIDSMKAKLSYAKVDKKDWFEVQSKNEVGGIRELESIYFVDTTYVHVDFTDKKSDTYEVPQYYIMKSAN